MLLAALATIAIVTQDQAALRAEPRDSAQQQAVLWQGEVLEIRGERMNYLHVYDHRLERGGYIRAAQVRTTALEAEDAPALLSVVRFLRDTPGAEALGIGYTAAYLKAAPAQAITSEPFDALGTMADRLARQASSHRASSRQNQANDAALAAHLEVATSYGITLQSFEREGRMQICYDGDAFRRVLAMPSTNDQRARAALALTRHDCVDPNLGPVDKYNVDNWRAEILERVQLTDVPEYLKNRVRIRRAGVWASLAYQRARRGEDAATAANRSLQKLAAINKIELTEEDNYAYTDAAVRVGASRWAAEPETNASSKLSIATLSIATSSGQPGETCVQLLDAKHNQSAPLLQRCTYGVVWAASARANAQGTTLTLAVQPLESWRELWVFQHKDDGWVVDVLPPSTTGPDIGYLEFAGWVPGTIQAGTQILAAREAKVDGRYQRSFEIISLESLQVKKQASKPDFLSTFYRWQDPLWKQQTISIR